MKRLVLQWGYGLEAVDNEIAMGAFFPKGNVLQWGHGSEAVDN